jgi:drug/metabolite transporter (DMT)-like permease
MTAPSLFKPGAVIIKDIPFFIILGVFQMALPFFLFTKGQIKLGAMEASLFKLLEPVVATIWVALLVREIPSIYSVIGGLVVITALFFKTFIEYRSSVKQRITID